MKELFNANDLQTKYVTEFQNFLDIKYIPKKLIQNSQKYSMNHRELGAEQFKGIISMIGVIVASIKLLF